MKQGSRAANNKISSDRKIKSRFPQELKSSTTNAGNEEQIRIMGRILISGMSKRCFSFAFMNSLSCHSVCASVSKSPGAEMATAACPPTTIPANTKPGHRNPHNQFPRGSACAKGDSISRVRPCCPDSSKYVLNARAVICQEEP
jgi:hypothetical protein